MRADDILGAVGNTPLVGIQRLSPRPSVRLWAKLEGQNPTGSLKDRIAVAMIEEAERSGDLTPDRTILEPTSGNTGIALALVARRKGYRMLAVLPDNASEERVRLLELYGAEIVSSPADKGTNGAIEVARRLAEDPRYFMPFQYGNPANPRAHHEGTGAEIVRDLPEVTHLVDGLRSLDEGFIPPILDESVLDRKLLVSAEDAVRATRELAQREGIFAGISSGAVLHTARRVAEGLDEGDVVCLLADGGWKYLSTRAWTGDLDRAADEVGQTLWW